MSEDFAGDTLLRKQGVRSRMRCSGAMAARITDTFVTVEQLVEAVESDRELTSYDGVGTMTAVVIEEWWANRFERERHVDNSTVEQTSSQTATIHFHQSWGDAIGEEPTVETEDEQ